MSFTAFTLDPRVRQGLEAAKYLTATPIQAAAIPAALDGHDLIGTAQTGTGKTAAFVLPILHRLLTQERKGHGRTRALIVTPTRELAEQIQGVVTALGKFTPLRVASVYGGVGMQPQEKALRQGVEVIVACPGRLLDHVERGNAKLDQVEVLVLDEADRMLDMGFLPSIQKILKLLPSQRQTLLFSATFDGALERLMGNHLRSPKHFAVNTEAPADTVSHVLYPVPQHLKTSLLLDLLKEMTGNSILIFTRTKHRADRITERIERAGHTVAALHANKTQGQRQKALDQFRAGKIRILVATDIAARGLDIEAISHVVNYDIPDTATTYIHRIGRTGRAERTGEAFTLVTVEDRGVVRDIEKILGTPITRRAVSGFDYTEAPKPSDPSAPRSSGHRPGAGAGAHRRGTSAPRRRRF
jgi:ATP-dependent RNA helicase RhlE